MSLELCTLCPRTCHVNRLEDTSCYCGESTQVRLARAALHFWEEPTISGTNGSGAVFFSGCNLKCVYCQNRNVAQGKIGKAISIEHLAAIFLKLQEQGAHNINLVTPSHFVLQIIEALKLARNQGLVIPIVYNTSGYERVETLKLLKGYVDIFLTDFKYASPELAQRYSSAFNYPYYASHALDEMFSLVGPVVLDQKTQIMKQGIIVRHLLLPTHLDDSKSVLRLLSEKPYRNDIQLSIMSQYTPFKDITYEYPELAHRVDKTDYEELLDYSIELGFEDSFCQEGDPAQESFIPSFDYEGI